MSDNSKGGITAIDLLQVCLIVLKALNLITWCWIWVLAPTWIGPIFVIIVVIIFHRR